MRARADIRGRVVIALAIGFCVTAMSAQRTQQARPSSESREATLPVILSIEDDRASTQGDLQVLLGALRGPLADRAIRSLGRLERRDVITDLLPYLAPDNTRPTTALALGLALRGPALDGVPHGQQEGAVREALLAAGETQLHATAPLAPFGLDHFSRTLGRLPVEDVESLRAVETFLRKILEKPFPQVQDAPHIGAARGLESLARLRRKIATLDDETIKQLRTVARTIDPRRADQQRNALAALIAASSVDADTLEVVLGAEDPEVRRLAVLALSGSASTIDDEERLGYIRRSLSDTSPIVRLEGVRAWTRRGVKTHGCQPLLDALSDQSRTSSWARSTRSETSVATRRRLRAGWRLSRARRPLRGDGSGRCTRFWRWQSAIASAPRSACCRSRCIRPGKFGCTRPEPLRSSMTCRC